MPVTTPLTVGSFEHVAALSTGGDRQPLLTPADASTDPAVQLSLEFLRRLVHEYRPKDFSVRFWDGSIWTPDPEHTSLFTLVLSHPGALRQMFWHRTELRLGEAFLAGDFLVEGDLESSFRLVDHLMARRMSVVERISAIRALRRLPNGTAAHIEADRAHLSGTPHSPSRDRQAVTYHYDRSTEFFAVWLDPAMVYSCAYFSHPDEGLEQAQRQKMDYVCRKLRLRSGERFLDIGCGWGGLIVHAARRFGVTGLGITLSEPQALVARDRIQQAGVSRWCRVDVGDYRDLTSPVPFDKIASVGMVEHTGRANLPEYFRAAWCLLRPGGAFLLHGIAESPASQARHGPFFGDRYVFPDTELPLIGELLQAAEGVGFEVRDVESLREHYVLTLRHWRERLEARRDAAVEAEGAAAYNVWRLFLAGAAYRFRIGHYNLYQTLLVKPDNGASGFPLTRADWYLGSDRARAALT